MECRQHHAHCDADAFVDVIVLRLAILLDPALTLGEDDDQVRRSFEEGFVFIGADWFERVEPVAPRFRTLASGPDSRARTWSSSA